MKVRRGLLIKKIYEGKDLEMYDRIWIMDNDSYEAFTYASIICMRYNRDVGIFDVNLSRNPWQIASLSVAISEICNDFIISFRYRRGIERKIEEIRYYMKQIRHVKTPRIFAISDNSVPKNLFDGVITRKKSFEDNISKILISKDFHEGFDEIICKVIG